MIDNTVSTALLSTAILLLITMLANYFVRHIVEAEENMEKPGILSWQNLCESIRPFLMLAAIILVMEGGKL